MCLRIGHELLNITVFLAYSKDWPSFVFLSGRLFSDDTLNLMLGHGGDSRSIKTHGGAEKR